MDGGTLLQKGVIEKSLSDVMQATYLRYMEQAVMHRALPDVRDGMKPVHRRIAYAMFNSFGPNGSYFKSARIVGDVMGKYHPHGDSSIYEAMVRMAQSWSLNVPIVDGQGNFGSLEGDRPAAMRYTEARMTRLYYDALQDIKLLDPKRSDMKPTYDEKEREPSVLPVRFPAILVNAVPGIAVGVATSIPTFNFYEVCQAAIAVLRNPDLTYEELFKILPAPDFPTGGNIHDIKAIQEAMRTGRGSFPMTGTAEVIEEKNHDVIEVRSLPWGVDRRAWLEKLIELNNKKEISITAVDDESSKSEMLIRLHVAQGTDGMVVLNKLHRMTGLRSSFSFNSICIHKGRPVLMGVLDILKAFCDFRRETVFSRIEYEVNGYRDKMIEFLALWIARYNIEETIRIIRGSPDEESAIRELAAMEFVIEDHPQLKHILKQTDPDMEMPEKWLTGPVAAKAIIEKKLKFLTQLNLDKVQQDIADLYDKIVSCEYILEHDEAITDIIEQEMSELSRDTKRRTKIHPMPINSVGDEDLIVEKNVLITLTEKGAIKMVPTDEFTEQKRGGQGKKGMPQREDDNVVMSWSCSNKDTLLVFTKNGHAFAIKAYTIEEGTPLSKGRHIGNFLPSLARDDKVCSMLVKPEHSDRSIVFVTSQGTIRRNSASDFDTFTVKGKQAMKLPPQTSIVSVLDVAEGDNVMLYSSDGKAIRIVVDKDSLRIMNSRASMGVNGMSLAEGATVIGAIALPPSCISREEADSYIEGTLPKERMKELEASEVDILTVTRNGFGKRMSSHSMHPQGRGGQGVLIGNKTTEVILCRVVNRDDSLSITTDQGSVIRIPASDIVKYRNRTARGVTLLRLQDGTRVVDCTVIKPDAEEMQSGKE